MVTIDSINRMLNLRFKRTIEDFFKFDEITGNAQFFANGKRSNYIALVNPDWKWDAFCFAADKIKEGE